MSERRQKFARSKGLVTGKKGVEGGYVRVQFWGTRGSIAKPGPSTTRYGGNTSCLEVRSARGTLVIIDCGTGGHSLGQKLMSGHAKGLRGNILISHTHWDHIQGIPFFAPLFSPDTEWDIYGPKGLRESLREALAGQMQYTYFPVTLDQCVANIRYHDLVEGAFTIDDIEVSTRYLNHPALTLGYRLQVDGATVVYACDHEPHSRVLATGDGDITGQDLRHAEFLEGADLLIHDAQYTAKEYPEKIGWGHSPAEYVVRLGQYAKVKSIALSHHDPLRDDDALDRLIANLRQKSALDVFAAFEGQVVEVAGSPTNGRPRCFGEFQAETPIEPTLLRPLVLLGLTDISASLAISEAARAEEISAKSFSTIEEVRMQMAERRPLLVVLEHDPPRINGMDMSRAIWAQANDHGHLVPVIMVTGQEDQAAGAAAGVTDCLIKPITTAYARTKIRASLLKKACQWVSKGASTDQEGRASPFAVRVVAPELDKKVNRAASVQVLPQGPAERKHSPERYTNSDKSALLWMYGREIAPFDTPTFSRMVGEIIAHATQVRRGNEHPISARMRPA
jgi:phosphoribosyl 1,2-cyclic phosphodiesterase/DNA-binding NarL/FixJ family response regulator